MKEGPEAFAFEVLDLLSPAENASTDLADDLRVLEALWLQKLGLTEDEKY
jgi:hypothetical protein